MECICLHCTDVNLLNFIFSLKMGAPFLCQNSTLISGLVESKWGGGEYNLHPEDLKKILGKCCKNTFRFCFLKSCSFLTHELTDNAQEIQTGARFCFMIS